MPSIELPLTTALVVVDVQAGTLPNARAVGAEEVVSHVGSLVEAFRGSDRPVAFVVSTGTAPGVTEYGPGGRASRSWWSPMPSRTPIPPVTSAH